MTYPKPYRNQGGSHMMRVADDAMEPRYRTGHWLGLVRCRRPGKGRDVVFLDKAGAMIVGEVLGDSPASWRVGQFHGEPRYTVRRLSCARWRPAWRVVAVYLAAESGSYYEAVALGLTERATAIVSAIGKRGPMPAPLTDEQRRALPRIFQRRG